MQNNPRFHSNAPSNPDALYPSAVNSPIRPGSAGKHSSAPLSRPESETVADDESGDDSDE